MQNPKNLDKALMFSKNQVNLSEKLSSKLPQILIVFG